MPLTRITVWNAERPLGAVDMHVANRVVRCAVLERESADGDQDLVYASGQESGTALSRLASDSSGSASLLAIIMPRVTSHYLEKVIRVHLTGA